MSAARGAALAATVVLLVGAGLWAVSGRRYEAPQAGSPVTPAGTAILPRAQPASTPGPPPGYRVAGVAAGAVRSFVAVEMPDGKSELFHLGDDVPGLGRLVGVEPKQATFAAEQGLFTMHVEPKPTRTGLPEAGAAPRAGAAETPGSEGAEFPPPPGQETSGATTSS